jgi:hypothetical protein
MSHHLSMAAFGWLRVPRYSAGRGITWPDLVSPAGLRATAREAGVGYGNPLRLPPAMTIRLAATPFAAEPPAPCAGVRGAGTNVRGL